MFPKINCVFHPEEILTNFCVQKNCLLPLCPTCIKIHTIQHISLKTNPKYQQINQLLSQVSKELKDCSNSLMQNISILNEIENKRQIHKEMLIQKILILKQEIIGLVESHFNQLRIEVDQSVKQLDLNKQIQKFRKTIHKHIQLFKLLEETLYSQKAMRTVIKFKSEQIGQKSKICNQIIQQFLHKCQNSVLLFDLQYDYKNLLKNCLNELTLLKSSQSYYKKIELLDISQTLTNIRQDLNKNVNNNKIDKQNFKNNVMVQSIRIDHNRSKRSNSSQGKQKNRSGLHLIHLQQIQSYGKTNQKKVSFNRLCIKKKCRQNINPKFID